MDAEWVRAIALVIFFTTVIMFASWVYDMVTGWFHIDDLHDLDVDEDEVSP